MTYLTQRCNALGCTGDRRRKRICSPVAVNFGNSKLRLTGPTSNMEAELRPGTSSWTRRRRKRWRERRKRWLALILIQRSVLVCRI